MNPFGPALCLLAALLGAGTAAAVESRELASVVVMDATPPLFGMPAGAPRPVWYNVPDSLAAGCGLVRPETPTRIDPLLEPEAESDWPSCQGFIDGAAFRWRDGPAYVFRYRQRDTREDTYTVSAFVTAKADNQGAFDALNAKDTPKIKSVRKLAAWGKATLAGLAAANAAYQDSPRDAIQTDHAYLSLARDGGSSTCRISADLVAEDSGFPPLTC